jgi:hypothetical protein
MLISHKHRIVIFTLERTASTSIHNALEKYFDISIKGTFSNLELKHIPTSFYDQVINPFLSQSYYKIAVIRNPIDRCVSLYKSKQLNISFSDWWIENRNLWISQKHSLSVNNQLYVDRLFDFNKFNKFFMFVSQVLGTFIKIPNLGKSSDIVVDIPDDIMKDMQNYLSEDIELYKKVVAANGELIINRYHSLT